MNSRARRASRLLPAALCAIALAALAAAPAQADFGLKGLEVTFTDEEGAPSMQAGSHPFAMTVNLEANTKIVPEGPGCAPEEPGVHECEVPEETVKDLRIALPEGMVGDPYAAPRCSSVTFIDSPTTCPLESVVGKTFVFVGQGVSTPGAQALPVYNLPPSPGSVLRLGFAVGPVPVVIEVSLKDSPPYNPLVSVTNVSQVQAFYSAKTIIWGVPADSGHDDERGPCLISGDSCSVSGTPRPFLTMPRSCGPLSTVFEATSWQHPAEVKRYQVESAPGATGCGKLGFSAVIGAEASTSAAGSASGLRFDLSADAPGLTSATGIADSDIKKALVTLPEGMTANPGLAEGLRGCSEAALDRETPFSGPGEGCPQAAKLGEVEVETPILEGRLLRGQVYIAEPRANPFGSLIALYMVIKDPELGISVKLAGKVTPDPRTGQLVTSFGEPGHELPQVPVSEFRFRFREGARAPLITPPRCGSHETEALFTPWAKPAAADPQAASFEISSGPGGGPCPSGAGPFDPRFEAGSSNNAAGAYSPFLMRLSRADGEQDMTKFSAVLPPGVTARLAGLAHCPEASIAAAGSRQGRDELASPSCPAPSQIGRVVAGAGVGSQLTYVNGSLHLAGPYKGAPLSVVAIVPAVAGPFDVGTVVTRVGLRLNPKTGQGEVDGAASDPLPHILEGIPLKVRDIRVLADRPGFTLNPTSCEPSNTFATIWGGGSNPFSAADDGPFGAASRYQAAGCAALEFDPKLAIKLRGGVKRGAHPALRAVVTPRPGQANFSSAAVTLPRSAFLEQSHIRTICTRVQFAAGPGNGALCPPGARYGTARAWSPLLDAPAQGPVYLRSSDNKLPDLVVALKGPASAPVEIELSSRIDSVKGGIRSTFTAIPDLPVSRFILDMQGGKKGLIVNSRHLCHKPKRNRARARLRGQNGRFANTNPRVIALSCAKKRRMKREG